MGARRIIVRAGCRVAADPEAAKMGPTPKRVTTTRTARERQANGRAE
jgi:hypothetical protein